MRVRLLNLASNSREDRPGGASADRSIEAWHGYAFSCSGKTGKVNRNSTHSSGSDSTCDPAAVGLDDVPGDEQAQARALLAPGAVRCPPGG